MSYTVVKSANTKYYFFDLATAFTGTEFTGKFSQVSLNQIIINLPEMLEFSKTVWRIEGNNLFLYYRVTDWELINGIIRVTLSLDPIYTVVFPVLNSTVPVHFNHKHEAASNWQDPNLTNGDSAGLALRLASIPYVLNKFDEKFFKPEHPTQTVAMSYLDANCGYYIEPNYNIFNFVTGSSGYVTDYLQASYLASWYTYFFVKPQSSFNTYEFGDVNGSFANYALSALMPGGSYSLEGSGGSTEWIEYPNNGQTINNNYCGFLRAPFIFATSLAWYASQQGNGNSSSMTSVVIPSANENAFTGADTNGGTYVLFLPNNAIITPRLGMGVPRSSSQTIAMVAEDGGANTAGLGGSNDYPDNITPGVATGQLNPVQGFGIAGVTTQTINQLAQSIDPTGYNGLESVACYYPNPYIWSTGQVTSKLGFSGWASAPYTERTFNYLYNMMPFLGNYERVYLRNDTRKIELNPFKFFCGLWAGAEAWIHPGDGFKIIYYDGSFSEELPLYTPLPYVGDAGTSTLEANKYRYALQGTEQILNILTGGFAGLSNTLRGAASWGADLGAQAYAEGFYSQEHSGGSSLGLCYEHDFINMLDLKNLIGAFHRYGFRFNMWRPFNDWNQMAQFNFLNVDDCGALFEASPFPPDVIEQAKTALNAGVGIITGPNGVDALNASAVDLWNNFGAYANEITNSGGHAIRPVPLNFFTVGNGATGVVDLDKSPRFGGQPLTATPSVARKGEHGRTQENK